MKRAIFFAIGLLVALSPAQVDAQTLDGFIQPQEYLDWVGGSGVSSTGLDQRVQVGPYQGEFDPFNLRTVSSNRFALYCVDYLHYARTSTDIVNVYGLGGDVGDVSTTRFGSQDSYVQAAYLASMFDDYEDALNRDQVWSGLHAAIWNVTSGVDVVAASDGDVRGYMDSFLAMDVPDAFTGDGWYVLSATALADDGYANVSYDGSGQEFLVRRASVPEPAAILLMLTGLVMLVGFSRRRILGVEDV